MPTNGPNGIEIKIGGDATPLIADIEAAKAKVESSNVSGKVSAGAAQAATEVAAIGTSAEKSAASLNQMGQAADKAVGPTSDAATGLKGLNKVLGDTVGQVQALIGKFAIVTGVATGMFALGRAIREAVVEALKDGTAEAKKFKDELDKFTPADRLKDFEKQIKDVEAALATATEDMERTKGTALVISYGLAGDRVQRFKAELTELNRMAETERKALEARRDSEQKIADKKKADDAAQQAAKEFDIWFDAYLKKRRTEKAARDEQANDDLVAYRDLLNKRIDASAEYNARVDKALEDEATARERQIQDFRDDMRQLGDEMEKQARRTQQAWESSLRSIREASNAAFNTDNARSMVELAGNLNQTATTASANMNRIIVGGTD